MNFWSTFTGGIRKEYLEESIERYTAANPNISVELATAPMGKEMETKLNVSFASGTSPDIIGHAIVSIAERADKGHYLAMDSYFDAYEDKDDILDIAIRGFPEYHGKRYGLTFYPIPEPYIYRKRLFCRNRS